MKVQKEGKKKDLKKRCILQKIVSGGQTGADIAALRAAKKLGLETGGYSTFGFVTTLGRDPELGSVYGLQEMPKARSLARAYISRSIKNAQESDATLAFRFSSSVGTDKTIGYCRIGRWCVSTEEVATETSYRPVLVISSLEEEEFERNRKRLREFVRVNSVKVLNVAGHRASDSYPHIEEQVEDFLIRALGR